MLFFLAITCLNSNQPQNKHMKYFHNDNVLKYYSSRFLLPLAVLFSPFQAGSLALLCLWPEGFILSRKPRG